MPGAWNLLDRVRADRCLRVVAWIAAVLWKILGAGRETVN
jgi:hypothetical protein